MTTHSPITIDASLVTRLVAAQFPQWAHLSIRPIEPGGWDNRTFHLGEQMTVRLPSAEAYVPQIEKEHRWLPRLAPHLPFPIPSPVALGDSAEGYPWHWSIYRWLDGETAALDRISNLTYFATDLAKFLSALQRIDSADGPPAGPHNFYRGGTLTVYSDETHRAIAALHGKVDTQVVREVWEMALSSTWGRSPVWVHGDVAAGNLLVNQNGELSAVIDFGTLGVGDPACDLSIAWTLFSGESRSAFRKALHLDPGTWARARGWTLWKALIVLAGHPAPSHEMERSRKILEEVLADHRAQE